jgi:hypothetical protein
MRQVSDVKDARAGSGGQSVYLDDGDVGARLWSFIGLDDRTM